MSDEPRVRVLTREGCHLCEVAETVVAGVCDELGEQYAVTDIDADDADPALAARYDEQVPVTFVDGRQHDFWRVDPDRLRQALTHGGRSYPDAGPGSPRV